MSFSLPKFAEAANVYVWKSHGEQISRESLKMFLKERKIEKIFLDANVLLYTHASSIDEIMKKHAKSKQGTLLQAVKAEEGEEKGIQERLEKNYLSIIDCLCSMEKVTVCINEIVISEFAHRCFNKFFNFHLKLNEIKWDRNRDEKFRIWRKKQQGAYLDSQEGGEIIKFIAGRARKMAKVYERAGVTDKNNFEEITRIYEEGKMEFNDCVTASTCCKEGNMALLTHDADFSHPYGFPIVTASYKLRKERERALRKLRNLIAPS